MSEYVVAQAAVLIVPTLGKGSDSFKLKLKAELAQVNEELSIQVKADTAKMVAQIKAAKAWADGQQIDLKVNELGITKSITEIRHKYQDLAREMKKGLILDLKVTGMALLPQLAQGLAAANASIVQLTQSSALLPGILSGVLSSVSALATGLGGVKGAFKEYSDAQKNAASEGLKARNAAQNVNNAYRDLNRTVKDAKRSLEDLNAQLRDAPLDEADAIIRVQEARAEAADKYQKSGLQQQKDALNVLKAENELADTRLRGSRIMEDVANANAKGVAGADAVVDTTDRLSKAMDDAATKSTKLTDALGLLSPNAQNFVQTVTGMRDEWMSFRDVVQDKLFEGLGAEVVKLGQSDLPVLQKGFSAISGEINGNLKTAMAALQTDTNKGFFERIFGNTATAQGTLDNAINPLVDAFLRLSAVGSDFLPRLADGLADVLTRFDNFVVRAEGDGSLVKWMNSGIDALKELGNSIINIGSMLSSLNDAFTDSGGNSLLTTLESATQRVAELMKSADGQQKLKQFFMDTRAELAKWRPLLDELPRVFQNLAQAGRAWGDVLLPFLTRAGTLLAEHPALVQAIFSAFMLWKNVAPVVKALHGMLGNVTEALTKLNTSVFANSTGHIGRFATAAENAKNKINGVAGAILSPLGLVAAATLAVTWIGTRLLNAHDDAAAAARRQQGDLDELRQTLDDVTGSATKASGALTAKSLQQGVNEATGQNYGNLLPLLNDPKAAIDAVQAGDVQGALAQIKGGAITAEDVKGADGGKFWQDKGQSLTDAGLNAQDVADALNGDKAKAEKYQKWQDEARRIGPLPAGVSKEILSVLPSSATTKDAPSLQNVQDMLPNNGALRAATAGELRAKADAVNSQGASIRELGAAQFGRASLKPDNPFAALGILVDPALGPDGGVLYTRSKPADGSPQEEQLRSAGVTFTPDGDRFKVELSPAASNTYLQKFASGGLISGAGSGTSDSILARLSHGEYVVNADSTSKHLGLLDSINRGGMPGYKVGGPVPKAPAPAPSPIVPSLLDTGKNAYTPSINSSGATMDAANGLGAFNHNDFQSAGQAQAARRGTDTAAKAAAYDPGGNALSGIGNLMGKDTYTMKVTTADSAWTALNAPTPDSRRRPFDGRTPSKFIDPNTPKNLSEFGSQLFGVPIKNNPATKNLPYPTAGAPNAPTTAATAGGVGTPHITGAVPGPVPHLTGAVPGPVPHLTGALPGPAAASNALPAMLSTPIAGQAIQAEIVQGVTAEVQYGAQEAAKYGLRVSSGLRPGDTGFHGTGQAGDYSNQVNSGPPTAEMTAFANEVLAKYAPYIDELIYAGAPNNIYRGQLVPSINMPGSPYNDAQAGYHGDHVHIAWKAGALQQIMAMGGAPADILSSLGGSPSNMPMANTPGGVMLPQFTFGNGNADAPSGNGGQAFDLGKLFDNYVKSVQKNWGSILENLVKNAGSIAMKFLGDFFGIDLSPIMNIANAVSGDANNAIDTLTGKNNNSGGGLDANASVSDILSSAEYQSLPPSMQQMVQTQGGGQEALASLRQVLSMAQQSGAGSPGGYSVSGGAEQWRPVVRKVLQERAAVYGIKNLTAWENALVQQIQTESGGNPNSQNLNDTNGRGGTQQVFGLGNFLPSTFAAHNVTGGDITDGVANIYAMIDYVAQKYGMDASGAPLQIGRPGVGYASGGKISGMGNGKSDSILARVSNGEYIVKANAASKNLGLLNAINSGGKLPGFVDGGVVGAPPIIPPPVTTPPPPPSPVPPAPMGPQAGADAGQPTAPAPDTAVAAPGDPASNTLQQVGDALSSVGAAVGGGGAAGAEAPAGGSPTADPRSVLGAAPQNLDHNLPAVSQGIQAAGSAISSAVSTAMSAAAMAGTAGAGAAGGGAASGAASSAVSGLINAGAGAVSGAVNILSSLLVGTTSSGGGGTAGAYGAPLIPKDNQQNYGGPAVVNNWNGGVHTSNNEEFYKTQQRRELQNASPMLARR